MIKYSTKIFTFGDIVYLKTDEHQEAHILVEVKLQPSYKADEPAVPKFIISFNGNLLEVYDFEISLERKPVEESSEEDSE